METPRLLKLTSVQLRLENGDTPVFEAGDLRRVFARMSGYPEAKKLMIGFSDEEGQTLRITLRETDEGWILYGFDPSSPTGSMKIPSMLDYAQAKPSEKGLFDRIRSFFGPAGDEGF